MAASTLNLRTPNGYNTRATMRKMGYMRFATLAEAANTEIDDLAITPATVAAAASAGVFTSLTVEGTTLINNTGAANTTIGTGGTGSVHIGNATGNTAVTGSLTASTGLTATAGGITATGTSNINTTGSAVTTIGTGGTGATHIGNATGNTAVTGSLTASTTLTATLGNITATNGNFVKGTAGNKDVYTSVASSVTAGANSAGYVALASGTATVATTAVTASSLIRMTRQGLNSSTALGSLSITSISANTNFIITAVDPGTPADTITGDESIIFWEIVN